MITASEKERYQRYLCSREWAEKRKLVLIRSDNRCERCHGAPVSHVHHLTYIRKYDERPEDLQGLCEPCHEFIHGKRDDDPALEVPPRLLGRKIESVYLAGKITEDSWRNGIITDGSRWYAVDDANESWIQSNLIHVPGSKYRLDYCGPFWMDLWGGHGSISMNRGDHAFGTPLEHGE